MYYNKTLSSIFMVVLLIGSIAMLGMGAGHEKAGGVLRYAMIDEPPTLDQQVMTSDLATTIAQHMFEGLYTFDSEYKPVPLLVESDEIKEDGELVVMQLREGVPFHNGKEMTSADVVASLQRWGEHGVRGPVLFEHVEEVEADGKYTVNIHFKEPFSPWKSLLAFINGGPVIYPEEVVDQAGEEPIELDDYIGTGPYKFEEWQGDRYVRLTRFEDYAAVDAPADGYAGERVAYFDELRFIPVPDDSTRFNGIQAGDYDYAENLPGDLYESVQDDEDVQIILDQGPLLATTFLNHKEGIMANKKLRQAVLAALDMRPAMQATFGPEALWELEGSFAPEGSIWYSEAGTEYYSQADPERAQELADEAGYDGEPIRYMTTTSYQYIYDSSVVFAEQLGKAGFNIDLQVYDWSTLTSRRTESEQWDMFQTGHGFVPHPILYTWMSATYPGWFDTPEKDELLTEFTSTFDDEESQEVWDELQELCYEEVQPISTGHAFNYNLALPEVKGIDASVLIWPHFWNAWEE
ncbi:MAG: ABC transporter substrate-binding protein [Candidatus Acetothermia bacterium]